MRARPLIRVPRGFTLFELMVALTVAAILCGIGIPSFRSLISRQRITAAANGFLAAARLARSEAIRRGRRVDLAPAAAGDWSQGWVVFVDMDDDQQLDSGEAVLFRHGPVSTGISIQSTFSGQYVAYNGSGRTRSNASSQVPHFGAVSFAAGQQVRKVVINFLGRAHVCSPAGGADPC